jgi:hypothetical protein
MDGFRANDFSHLFYVVQLDAIRVIRYQIRVIRGPIREIHGPFFS